MWVDTRLFVVRMLDLPQREGHLIFTIEHLLLWDWTLKIEVGVPLAAALIVTKKGQPLCGV